MYPHSRGDNMTGIGGRGNAQNAETDTTSKTSGAVIVKFSGGLRATEEERKHAGYCAADGGEERWMAVLRWMAGRR